MDEKKRGSKSAWPQKGRRPPEIGYAENDQGDQIQWVDAPETLPEKARDLETLPAHAGPVDAKTAEDEEERNSCPAKVKKVDKYRPAAIGGEVAYAVYPWQVPTKGEHVCVAKKEQENRHAPKLVD